MQILQVWHNVPMLLPDKKFLSKVACKKTAFSDNGDTYLKCKPVQIRDISTTKIVCAAHCPYLRITVDV